MISVYISISCWWFQIFFIFTPIWGKFPIWRAYFSDGWFNHQPDLHSNTWCFFWWLRSTPPTNHQPERISLEKCFFSKPARISKWPSGPYLDFSIHNKKTIPSMYGIFAYIWLIRMVNVGKYTIHGWYGKQITHDILGISSFRWNLYCITHVLGKKWRLTLHWGLPFFPAVIRLPCCTRSLWLVVMGRCSHKFVWRWAFETVFAPGSTRYTRYSPSRRTEWSNTRYTDLYEMTF